jgi:hypothetical protein
LQSTNRFSWKSKTLPKLQKCSKFHSKAATRVCIKSTPINNLLTIQPILTNNIPINSAQQAEDNENIKKAKNLIFLGSNLGVFEKFTPKNNSLIVQKIFKSNISMNSV